MRCSICLTVRYVNEVILPYGNTSGSMFTEYKTKPSVIIAVALLTVNTWLLFSLTVPSQGSVCFCAVGYCTT